MTVTAAIRDAPLGQVIRWLSGNKLFKYPEEEADFVCPYEHLKAGGSDATSDADLPDKEVSTTDAGFEPIQPIHTLDIEKTETARPHPSAEAVQRTVSAVGLTRSATRIYSNQRLDVEAELAVNRTKSIPIQPEITSSGQVLVTWYTTDDVDNPQNWSQPRKSWVASLIWVYTFGIYASSAIYTSSEQGVMEHFGVGHFKAELGLALFVLGYGVGPLLFSPLSEIPSIGRNPPYIASFALFVVLSVPTALVNDLGGLLFLRFCQGFFGSPCLATGAATMQDIYSLLYVPVAVSFWVSAAFSAPALGPLLSGFAVMAKGWRWSLWIILWLNGPIFLAWFIGMPETLEANILLRRAKRLRKLTGDARYVSQSEIDQGNMKVSHVIKDALIKPLEINIKDPAVLFTSVYSAIIYGIYYSFFEVFPITYGGVYGFNTGEIGIVFTCIVVGCAIGMTYYIHRHLTRVIPRIMKNGMGPQEDVLRPALFFVVGPTISLFLFGWTSRASIHWIAPTIFLTIYPATVFVVMQCIFSYLPMTYPQYAASLFAGNDLFRSIAAFGAVLFSRPMFLNLGYAKGCSLLGGLSVLGWLGMWFLYWRGAKLRARSKFAVKE